MKTKTFPIPVCRDCKVHHANCVDERHPEGAFACGCTHAHHHKTHYDAEGQFIAFETIEVAS